MLYGNLDGRGVWGRMVHLICLWLIHFSSLEALSCVVSSTLTPIQNESLFLSTKEILCILKYAILYYICKILLCHVTQPIQTQGLSHGHLWGHYSATDAKWLPRIIIEPPRLSAGCRAKRSGQRSWLQGPGPQILRSTDKSP